MGDEEAGALGLDDGAGVQFVPRDETGEQEADGDGGDPGVAQFAGGLRDGGLVQRLQLPPGGAMRPPTVLRKRRFTRSRSCQGASCRIE